MKRKQSIESVRWDLALRYRLIETVAGWEGRLTTGHLMQSFGISRQQASKDINSYITDYAPKNLEYDKHLKGYVPSRHFKPLFIDDSASAYLHLLNESHDRAPYVEGLALAYAHTEVLLVPDRTVRPELLRPLLRQSLGQFLGLTQQPAQHMPRTRPKASVRWTGQSASTATIRDGSRRRGRSRPQAKTTGRYLSAQQSRAMREPENNPVTSGFLRAPKGGTPTTGAWRKPARPMELA